ncbi:MAG TPA: folate family ECF transporter S component, partial [Eubacteriaceae bacterium]|nr:folate family ECF transporter S component [Eubacteriaceae bacterium]
MKTDAIKTSAFTTKNIVYIGLMISVSVVLKLIFEVYIPVGGFASLRINFTSIPIMLSGVLFGPVAGLITGTVSDLLCFVIKPAGPFFPGFTISSALTGFIPGVIYMLISKNKAKKMNYSLVNSIFVLVLSAGGGGVGG